MEKWENRAQTPAQEREQRAKTLVTLFEKGLDDADCIGYHGTSLEAVQHMLEHGHLPGQLDNDATFGYEKGDLFFNPIKSEMSDHPASDAFFDEKEALESAQSYAHVAAQKHFVMKSLGLDFASSADNYAADVLTMGNPYREEAVEIMEDIATRKGIDKKEIVDIIQQSEKRKGVVFALDKNVKDAFDMTKGDDDGDLRIASRGRFTLDHLNGLDPQGQQEWDFFEKLQKNT